jgi:hypothetical protein
LKVEETFAGGWTKAKLSALKPADRYTIWNRARKSKSPEAKALARVIEDLGLPYFDPAALKRDDPLTIRMSEIIYSPEGRRACEKAAREGHPAIAGVDPALSEALGIDYGGANMATNTAGILVGELMTSLGYVHGGKRPLPEGCVAKTGEFWIPRKTNR